MIKMEILELQLEEKVFQTKKLKKIYNFFMNSIKKEKPDTY